MTEENSQDHKATAPQATAPEATAPEATAPQATAPQATAPEATVPEATVPKATAPESTTTGTTALETIPEERLTERIGSSLTIGGPETTGIRTSKKGGSKRNSPASAGRSSAGKVLDEVKKNMKDAERLLEIVANDEFVSSESECSATIEEEESEDSVSVGSYIQQKELQELPDFFEILGQIPSVEAISFDQSVQIEMQQEEKKSDIHLVDTGKFTDPLTGQVIPSEISLKSDRSSRQHSTHDESEFDEEGEEEEDLQEFDLLLPLEIEEDKTVIKEDDGLDLWYSIEVPVIKRDTEVDFEELLRLANKEAMMRIITEFLEAIIDKTVDKCEYIDPNTILRQNLDKKQLMQELQERLGDLEVEQKARFFLNRKTVEYFRRKKAFRALLEDSPETITQVIEKYKEATTALDQLLGREEETKNSANCRIENLEAEILRKEEEAEENILGFEDLVRKTLHRDNFEKMKLFVENQLQKLAKLRTEISKIRLVLIQRQHTLATLIEKSNALDNLGEGLHMHDFEHLQTETQALGKKIEERNSDLNKLRTRCNADLHIMAHLKEKQQMMRNTITIHEGALQDIIDEKQHFRESLFNLKVDRSKIRNEIRDLSFQGGLIDKPALMLDYDETMERLVKLRVKVEGMRQKHSYLQRRIHELEDTCMKENHEGAQEQDEAVMNGE